MVRGREIEDGAIDATGAKAARGRHPSAWSSSRLWYCNAGAMQGAMKSAPSGRRWCRPIRRDTLALRRQQNATVAALCLPEEDAGGDRPCAQVRDHVGRYQRKPRAQQEHSGSGIEPRRHPALER